MSDNETPKWIKTWGAIVATLTGTLVLINQTTDIFKEKKPEKPAEIHVVVPSNEPIVMPMLRNIDYKIDGLRVKMGIQDSNTLVGKVDSTIIDTLNNKNIGGK